MNEIKSIEEICQRHFDCIICFSSFEERCLSMSKVLDIGKVGRAFILLDKNSQEEILKTNFSTLMNIYDEKASEILIDLANPIYTADIIIEKIISEYNDYKMINILLDISTFTHEILLILLFILRERSSKINLVCVYNNASVYCEGENVENKWLSKGIKEIRTVLGYPGNTLPTKKTHLIMLVGYEYERALDIINIIEPNTLSLGYVSAEETYIEKDKDANKRYTSLVEQMAISYSKIEKFTISCNNIEKTKEVLIEEFTKHREDNVIIVPLNNKVSTIGVALTVFCNPDVQICYGQPVIYNVKNYSIPSEKFCCYEFEEKDWNNI